MFDTTQSSATREENNRDSVSSNHLWSVDRWGRLLAGAGILLMTTLGISHHSAWLSGTLFMSINLVITALIDRCPLHDLLIRLGAKERENLYLPGGSVRPQAHTESFENHADSTNRHHLDVRNG